MVLVCLLCLNILDEVYDELAARSGVCMSQILHHLVLLGIDSVVPWK